MALTLILILLLIPHRNILSRAAGGEWEMLLPNIGISAMHMQLLNNDRVLMFDRTDFGLSNISLPNGKCRKDPYEQVVKTDCTAHSVEYDVASNSVRPLMVLTDVWCSSGTVAPDGTLVQTGGYNDGDHAVRVYKPCNDKSCDWREVSKNGLAQQRWYATSQVLPDGRSIIIGGRKQFSYEFYPKKTDRSYNFPFLLQTNDAKIENNLYPFVLLNVDGNLFVFSNNRAILFDYQKGAVVRNYPPVPGGDPRNYPSSGSAVLLPLRDDVGAEVLVCGGAPKGAYQSAVGGKFVGALRSCGRIRINDPTPKWAMENMPLGRVMGDMVLLPNENVLIVNGGGSGTAGWEYGRNPILSPVIYQHDRPVGSRFEVQNPSSRPRMYHSSAILLRDGRVLVGGNNPHKYYNFSRVVFPTDLTLEAFSPPYLDKKVTYLRPKIVFPASQTKIGYGQRLTIQFTIPSGRLNGLPVMVTMVAPSFATHSFSMNQRLLVLNQGNVVEIAAATYQVRVTTPRSGNLAPSGYYLIFVCHEGVPSKGIWVQIK